MDLMIGILPDNMIESPHYLDRSGHSMPEWASCSVKEASEKSGYNEEYLRRLIRQGRIEAVKIGPAYLIRVESLEEYVAGTQDANDARTGPRRKRA